MAPAATIGLYVYFSDKHEKEPILLYVAAYFAGVISTLPAGYLNFYGESAVQYLFSIVDFGTIEIFIEKAIFAFCIVGAGEELMKFLALRIGSYPRKSFNEPYDGIVYGAAVALGFASLENLFYVFEGGVDTAIARMFTAVPMHACAGIIMGYYIGKAKFSNKPIRELLKGWIYAAFLHGLYDYFLFLNEMPILAIGAVLSLFISIRLARNAMKIHREISPFKDNPDKID
ncbi:MAG: PrsW family intramembrane metalloprotease [Flavobacteriales bacterium]|nr:PrsW family intramembrane metalloprotease [Flavobacteriales bacterium]